MPWYQISVSLHLLAACVWVGGMVFLAAVILPVLRDPGYRPVAAPLIQAAGVRFRWVGWIAIGTLVLTGAANLEMRGYGWTQVRDGSLWQGRFGHILAVKLLLVAVIVAMSAVHDAVHGARFARLAGASPDSPAVIRLRRQAAWIGRLVLVLSTVVLVLGVLLVRGI